MTSSVIVSLRVAATPSRAFEVFTGEIGAWWQPNILFQFNRRKAGILSFEPGLNGRLLETYDDGESFEIGRITTWLPGDRLTFTWHQDTFEPGQSTQVEVKFEPVADQTRVTVQHLGWDSVPQEHTARHTMDDAIFLRRHADWWQALLKSLKARVIELTDL